MRRHLVLTALVALGLSSPQAQAQAIVHDPTNYAKLIEQAKTALDQLRALETQVRQGKTLLDSLNLSSGAGELAPSLNQLRDALPDLAAWDAAQGGAGALGERTRALRQAERLYMPANGEVGGDDLEAAGRRAARDLALAQTVAQAAARRQAGLQELQAALDQAPTARAALDLQARLASEQTMIANDQMRLQGLAMAQAADRQLERQRERERVAAARAARMAFYRRGFE